MSGFDLPGTDQLLDGIENGFDRHRKAFALV